MPIKYLLQLSMAVLFCLLVPLELFHQKNGRWRIAAVMLYFCGILLLALGFRLLGILLGFRTVDAVYQLRLSPFWSYARFDQADIRWQVYMNVFLFIPFGFLLPWCSEKLRKLWKILLIAAILSALIEATQCFLFLGLCETDDVIHNTLGAVIGYGYWRLLCRIHAYFRSENQMTTAQRELLNSIRGNLWGHVEQSAPPSEVLAEARKQAIIPLISSDSPEVVHYAVHSIRVLYEQDTLVNVLSEAAIPAVILKGTSAAIYYPDPFRRTMGDIDLLVKPERFDQALELLLQKGYVCKDGKEGTRHTTLLHGGAAIELHRRFSGDGIDVERYVQRGMEHPMTVEVDGHQFPMLPPLANGLVLLAHVAQHLRNGLGLRQMIDWMMYVHTHLTDEYWQTTFRPAASECGLETLSITATQLCRKHLGLPDPITWCNGADDTLVDDLLENLLITGNFGHVHGSGASVETVATNIKRTGLFRYLQQQGERNWKAYQEHKALKPLCWAYQICRYLRRGAATGRAPAQLASDYQRSRDRHSLLKRLHID